MNHESDLTIQVRRADKSDLPALARFGVALAQVHVDIDDRRFGVPRGGYEAFAAFFERELERPETIVLIAEDQGTPIGYAFVRMEPASIEALCEPSPWLHDIYVDPSARARCVGRQLVSAAVESARQLGSSSLMLGVHPANAQARHLFDRFGMRATMTEMRLDFE